MSAWSHQQALGEDLSGARFVLRAVQGCFKKRLPKYLNNVSSSLETLKRTIYFHGNRFAPGFKRSCNRQGCSSWPHEKKDQSGRFFPFFSRNFGSKWPKKKTKKKTVKLYLLEQFFLFQKGHLLYVFSCGHEEQPCQIPFSNSSYRAQKLEA